MQTSIAFKLVELENSSYHIILPATFNGSIRGHLIIDTGASKSIFDYTTLKKQANHIEAIESNLSSGINSFIDHCYQAEFASFAVGRQIISPFNAVLMDLSHVNKLYKKLGKDKILGLLGCDFLTEQNAVISFARKRVTLTCPDQL